MGRRHAKQAGGMGSETPTNAERAAFGYGTARERLGRDSVKAWDACALCLAPVRDAVVTPDGVLYEREAILENLLAQKKEAARRVAAWEAGASQRARAAEEAEAEAKQRALSDFHALNSFGGAAPASASAVGGAAGGGAAAAPFWVPGKGVAAAGEEPKPSAETLCPSTGKKLRLKDLHPVRFTRLGGSGGGGTAPLEPETDAEEAAAAARDDAAAFSGAPRFACPLCRQPLTNATAVVVLVPTASAVHEGCYSKLVAPEGTHDGVKVRPRDVVRLQRGGTGFASTSAVEASTYTLMGVGSGLADNRGQHAGGRSRFAGMRL